MANDITYEGTLGHSVKRLFQLTEKCFNEFLRPYGIARSQWYILYHLTSAQKTTQKDLLEILHVEAPTLSAAVESLERKGWLTSKPSDEDRRLKELQMTELGKKHWKSIPNPITSFRTVMMEGISSEEEQAAVQVLYRAIQNLERNSCKGIT